MSVITIQVDRERMAELELDTVIALEEGTLPARATRDLLATFMVDAQGKYVDRETARRIIGKTRVTDLADVLTDFAKQLMGAAVPPASGGES